MVRQVYTGMTGQEIAQATRNVHGIEVCRMEVSVIIQCYTPILLPARPAKDQREGRYSGLPLIGARWADALAPVVEMGFAETRDDGAPLREEGVEFGDGVLDTGC